MLIKVDGIEIFAKTFPGIDCPKCGKQTRLLATTNEWRFYCIDCNKRFNDAKQEYPPMA